jgi:ABC-type multidrug transport system fused ATPase/permease subunit
MADADGAPRRRPRPPIAATLRLLPEASPGLTVALAAGVVLAAALPAAFALASGHLVASIGDAAGRGFGSPPGRALLAATVTVVVLFALQQLSAPGVRALAEAVGRRLDALLRSKVMAATLAPAGTVHLDDPVVLDKVAAAQAVGTGQITPKEAVVGLSGAAIRILAGLGSAIVLAGYRWWLAAALMAVYCGLTRVLTADLRRTINSLRGHARRFRRSAYFRGLALEPAAAKELRVFGLAAWVGDRYTAHWQSAMEGFRRERRHGVWLPPFAGLVLAIAQGGTYVLLARSAARADITLGQLATYAAAATGIAGIFRIGIDDVNIAYGTAPVPSALEVAEVTGEPRFHPTGTEPAGERPRAGIRFENVSFRYPGRSEDVLSGLDLEIAAGRSLAIVGPNGAGKTTLVKLVARLCEPTGGRIVVDGTDLAGIEPRSWQRRVAATFQDFAHYGLSVADNVGFGAVERSTDTALLVEAAARAGLDEVVERLPAGWETVLSTQVGGGVDLSGGEWQRVALARALFALRAGAGVLVLDEPTAALDVRAEAAFYDRFLDLTAGVTTIVVSHRFSTVRRADRIVVLDGGQVVEDGDHASLMAAGGRYARMFAVQAAHFTAGAGAPAAPASDEAGGDA